MAEIFVVLIADDSKKKDKRTTCRHRHTSRDEALKCCLAHLDSHPNANAYVSPIEDAPAFVWSR